MTLRYEPVVPTTELPGPTAAYPIAEVRPQVSGLLHERQFAGGSDVGPGSVLYRIDPTPSQAALALVEANLPARRALAERLEGRARIRAVGEQEYDNALLQAESAKGFELQEALGGGA